MSSQKVTSWLAASFFYYNDCSLPVGLVSVYEYKISDCDIKEKNRGAH
jgi:hypothetical protein